jgi:hypothetical protein
MAILFKNAGILLTWRVPVNKGCLKVSAAMEMRCSVESDGDDAGKMERRMERRMESGRKDWAGRILLKGGNSEMYHRKK